MSWSAYSLRFPRFRGERHGLSCRFTTGAFGLPEGDRRHVTLPRIGVVRTHEFTRTLARHVDRGTGRIRSATVTPPGRTLVLLVVRPGRPARPGPGPAGAGGGCRPRRHVPGGAVHRGGHRQPAAPRGRPTRAAPPATPSLPPGRPGAADTR